MNVEKCVRLARAGDREALSALCAHFYPLLQRFFLKLNLPPADADDLSQSTLLRMMEKLDSFHFLPGRHFEGWLMRIAYHLFIDLKRKPLPLPLQDDFPLPDPSPGAEQLLLRKEAVQTVQRALSLLDPELQALLSMRYELDMPYPDIAAALDISPVRVKWRLHDALIKLKSIMEKGGFTP